MRKLKSFSRRKLMNRLLSKKSFSLVKVKFSLTVFHLHVLLKREHMYTFFYRGIQPPPKPSLNFLQPRDDSRTMAFLGRYECNYKLTIKKGSTSLTCDALLSYSTFLITYNPIYKLLELRDISLKWRLKLKTCHEE